jgi:CRP-like cAMP-binding protein
MMRKLGALAELDDLDRQAIRGLPSTAEAVNPGRHLVREGTAPRDCCLLVSGHACRYKVSANGRRQIVSFHIAGDLLDLQHLHLSIADHDVQTITAADVVWIPKTNLRTLARQRPAIAEAFWRDTLIDASIFREWVLNVGRRDARSRVAHMLCEFVARCSAAGLGRLEGFVWPMTQEQIGDATGLTAVHVNRMMKALSAEGAVERQPRGHAVRDWTRLKQIGEFDQAYLHAAASPGLSRVISA